MDLSQNDKKIILDAIRTGDFTRFRVIKLNLNEFKIPNLTKIYRGDDKLKYNYRLAEKLANILIIPKDQIKRDITRLIAAELNHYIQEPKKRDHIYTQLNNYITRLVAFSEKKRLIKFLVKFTLTSKALQSILRDNKNYEILFSYKRIISEVEKKNADTE